jgi:CBS domain-containing protein
VSAGVGWVIGRIVTNLIGQSPGWRSVCGVSEAVLHLSSVLRAALTDRAGEKLGRVEDLIVRLDETGYPPVTGLKALVGRREVFVPPEVIASMEPGRVQLARERLDLRHFERRPGEVLLGADVLGRKLIDVERAELVTANEIELLCAGGWWRVVGIDPSGRAHLRRLLRGRGAHGEGESLVDWTQLEPFVGHVPSSLLRLRYRRLAQLHPAQLADLVEAASHEEGEEIINAVGEDRELEADVFEELDDEHQVEFVRQRSDEEVARLLSRMATDDAADLISEIDQERRRPILALLPGPQQRQILTLLGYNPSTAGGLMSPDFILLDETSTAQDALSAVRVADLDLPPETLTTVYLASATGALAGSAVIVTLLRADPVSPAIQSADRQAPRVRTDAELAEVARVMTDYNLTMLPVVNDNDVLVGVVTVDDVLELTLPTGWRRRYGLAER